MVRKKTIALGTVIAAGVGYVAGLLTAPKSGRETRQDIRSAALKAKTEAERKLKQAHSELTTMLDEAATLAKKSKGKVNEGLNKARKQAETVRQKTREVLSAIHEGEAEDKDLQKAIDDVKKASAHLKKYLEKKTAKAK
ncbi:MAG TPA: YtxH domain-containing protein [Patescibacteria group bacterium]|nr:YtxH domain-containing protein [Patescibacteria group bacterium]